MLTGRAVHRLERRYYAAMLSAALVAVALGAASAYLAGSAVLLPHMLASIAVLLAGVNLVGAVLIYRPIRRYLMSQDANGIDLLKTVRRISPDTRVVVISWDGSMHLELSRYRVSTSAGVTTRVARRASASIRR